MNFFKALTLCFLFLSSLAFSQSEDDTKKTLRFKDFEGSYLSYSAELEQFLTISSMDTPFNHFYIESIDKKGLAAWLEANCPMVKIHKTDSRPYYFKFEFECLIFHIGKVRSPSDLENPVKTIVLQLQPVPKNGREAIEKAETLYNTFNAFFNELHTLKYYDLSTDNYEETSIENVTLFRLRTIEYIVYSIDGEIVAQDNDAEKPKPVVGRFIKNAKEKNSLRLKPGVYILELFDEQNQRHIEKIVIPNKPLPEIRA